MWSDNEDDVFIDNKTRDVMGLDTLAKKIISDEYPDNNGIIF